MYSYDYPFLSIIMYMLIIYVYLKPTRSMPWK